MGCLWGLRMTVVLIRQEQGPSSAPRPPAVPPPAWACGAPKSWAPFCCLLPLTPVPSGLASPTATREDTRPWAGYGPSAVAQGAA